MLPLAYVGEARLFSEDVTRCSYCFSPVLASRQIRTLFSRKRYTRPSTIRGEGTSGVGANFQTLKSVAVMSPFPPGRIATSRPPLALGATISPGTATGDEPSRSVEAYLSGCNPPQR